MTAGSEPPREPPAGEAESERPRDYRLVCPNCGSDLYDRGCKTRCPRCGFFTDCSDPW